MTFDGPLDTAVDLEIGQEVRAIVREALTNVGPARPRRQGQRLDCPWPTDWCAVTVTDNGRGVAATSRDLRPDGGSEGGMGLVNARRRAESWAAL